jgi:uncharacterized SAM-binding protein YcdF (DUF218 family)
LFTLSKAGWTLVQPSNLLLLMLILGSAALIAGWRQIGAWLTVGATGALTILGLLPIGAWLLSPLEGQFPVNPPLPDTVDGIIALGGGIDAQVSADRDQLALNEAAERLMTLANLGRRYPHARLAFSGGSSQLFGSAPSEAAVVKGHLGELGIDPKRVIFEDRSRNTFENARYSKSLLKPEPDECWLLITSAYHMSRALGVFQRAGWDVLPYPVDYHTTGTTPSLEPLDVARRLDEADLAVRSWLGLLAYYLMDRSSDLFPQAHAIGCAKPNRGALARVGQS